ncbi:MAG: hypothetical protein DCC75_04285 [Proteobacteria bacterium]|nr:MAG: hypothetical protein DCC75_04285 [Pseudomonadota bacterium]
MFASPLLAQSSASSWFLPLTVADGNTRLKFEVDSTWHTVHGKVSGVMGEIKLQEAEDPTSIQAHLEFPVQAFDTDNSSRDSRLREVMAEQEFPVVVFDANGLKRSCTPALVLRDGECRDELTGKLKIRAVSKEVVVPIVISGNPTGFHVRGEFSINWPEFGVEDPSILIASVDPVVVVHFQVDLLRG